MKTLATMIATLALLPGCKKSLTPLQRQALDGYTVRICACATRMNVAQASRCLSEVGPGPSVITNDLDDDSVARVRRAHDQAASCRVAAWKLPR